MMGTEVNVSDAHDFSDWEVSGMVIGNYYRVTLVNNAHNSPINPGISHIADITFEIPAGTPDASIVVLDLLDAEIIDITSKLYLFGMQEYNAKVGKWLDSQQ